MRSAVVAPHLRCNQACTFCDQRRPRDDLALVQPSAVRRRIDDALRSGADEIIVSGGEPTLRGDLASLVAHARTAGARRVVLETNATLIDEARARELREAGVDLARVQLSGWGEALDRVTRDEGGFAATVRGVDALLGAGCPVEIAAAVVRSTAAMLPSLPARLAGRFGASRLEGLALVVPRRAASADEVLGLDEVAPLLTAIAQGAGEAGLALRLLPGGPPPCIFAPGERPAYLYALSPGGAESAGFARDEACDGCQVADRCPGLAEQDRARGPVPRWPIRSDRGRRRLSLVGDVRRQIARELVTPSLERGAEGDVHEVVRVNFQCNQACHFCFVSTHLPPPGDEAVRAAILDATGRGVRVVLSGGEPTLNPRLVEYVALVRSRSSRLIELQTNAVRLDDRELVARLVEAGLDRAFVSLHGATAAVSDAVTGAPGTFARTLIGLDHLCATGIEVTVNFVVCTRNLDELMPLVRLAAARWPGAHVNVSFVAPSSDLVPADRDSIPRYSDALPVIAGALALARSLGVITHGLDSMCGVPLCLLPAGVRDALDLQEIPPGFDEGEFLKVDACGGCAFATRCFGVRRRYAALYGTSELATIP